MGVMVLRLRETIRRRDDMLANRLRRGGAYWEVEVSLGVVEAAVEAMAGAG